MSGRLAIYLATGASLGVILAYLLAGGASYSPLEVADPCEPRATEILDERGVFEGIVLSGIDGAACELGVSREVLTAALASEQALELFTEDRDITTDEVDQAVRAGLLRAITDAEQEGAISPTTATIARFIAERFPVSDVLDVFRALPGDPTIFDIIEAFRAANVRLEEIRSFLNDLGSELGLPEIPSLGDVLPDDIDEFVPEELRALLERDLREELEGLLPEGLPGDLGPLLPDDLRGALP